MAPLPNPTRFTAGKPSVAAVSSEEEEDRQSFTGLANHWSQLKLLHGDGKTSPVRAYVTSQTIYLSRREHSVANAR